MVRAYLSVAADILVLFIGKLLSQRVAFLCENNIPESVTGASLLGCVGSWAMTAWEVFCFIWLSVGPVLFHVGPSSADLRDCEAIGQRARKGIYESVLHAPLKDFASSFCVTLRHFDQ